MKLDASMCEALLVQITDNIADLSTVVPTDFLAELSLFRVGVKVPTPDILHH